MRMRTTTAAKIARDALCELGWLTRRTAPSKLPANSLTIVTFHRVLPPELKAQYPLPGLVVTPAELDFSLKFINQHYSCHPLGRSEERRVGKECRSGWSPDHGRKKYNTQRV